jgi:hypothetical protein
MLKKAFDEASKLPEKEQDEFALFVLEEIASERRWSEAFERSADRLRTLAKEALDDHEHGRTSLLNPDDL